MEATLVERLVQIMAQLVDEHRGLLRDGEAHQRALVAGDIETIHSQVDVVSTRVDKIYQIEQQRRQLATEFGDLFGVEAQEVNISFLAQHLDAREMEKLHLYSTELGDIMLQLVRENAHHRALVEQSMRYLHKSVELVADAMNQDVYGTGAKPAGGGHLFNVQA